MFKSKKIFSIHHRSLKEKFRASWFALFVLFMGVVLPGGCPGFTWLTSNKSAKGNKKGDSASYRGNPGNGHTRGVSEIGGDEIGGEDSPTAQDGTKGTQPTGPIVRGAKPTKLQANRRRKQLKKTLPQVNVDTDLQCGECGNKLDGINNDAWVIGCACDKVYHKSCIDNKRRDDLGRVQCKFCNKMVVREGVEEVDEAAKPDDESSEEAGDGEDTNAVSKSASGEFDSEDEGNSTTGSPNGKKEEDSNSTDSSNSDSSSSTTPSEVPTKVELDPCAAYKKCRKCFNTRFLNQVLVKQDQNQCLLVCENCGYPQPISCDHCGEFATSHIGFTKIERAQKVWICNRNSECSSKVQDISIYRCSKCQEGDDHPTLKKCKCCNLPAPKNQLVSDYCEGCYLQIYERKKCEYCGDMNDIPRFGKGKNPCKRCSAWLSE